ncbi:uncharacterized protein LOC135826108 [Sycon ciliatum]|uniref:uncharacterized protein LOC135826108 n=1 Tax=Sycon ciliatum TaxID=27933 RepID=UPI0031F6330F
MGARLQRALCCSLVTVTCCFLVISFTPELVAELSSNPLQVVSRLIMRSQYHRGRNDTGLNEGANMTLKTSSSRSGSSVAQKKSPSTAASPTNQTATLLSGLNAFECTKQTSWINQCAKSCVSGSGPVPRIAHVIQIGDKMGFTQWLSITSAIKFLHPRVVFLHHIGKLSTCWARRIQSHPLVQLNEVQRSSLPTALNGATVQFLAHLSDFMRTAALWQYGGVYMDVDAILTKPFDPLLTAEAVFSRQIDGTIGNGLIVARKNSCFMCAYSQRMCKDYDGSWAKHSVLAVTSLLGNAKRYPAVTVLPHKSGFFPYSWYVNDLTLLFRRDAKDSSFSPGSVYAIHLYNSALQTHGMASASQYSAIGASKTPFALAARSVLPPSFNASYADETKCLQIPLA